MKTMKLGLVVAFAMSMCVALQAQNHHKKQQRANSDLTLEQRAELRAKTMSVRLELTDKQEDELIVFFIKQAQEMKSSREISEDNRKAQRAESNASLTKIIGEENMMKLKEEQTQKGKYSQRGAKKGGKSSMKGKNRANRPTSAKRIK